MAKAMERDLASHTVLQTMLYINADGEVAGNVGYCYRYAHFGEPGDGLAALRKLEEFVR